MKPERERKLRKLMRGLKSIILKTVPHQWLKCACDFLVFHSIHLCSHAFTYSNKHQQAAMFWVNWPPIRRQLKHKMPSQVTWIPNAAWLVCIREWSTYYSLWMMRTHLTKRILILLYDLQFKQLCWHHLQLWCLQWMQTPINFGKQLLIVHNFSLESSQHKWTSHKHIYSKGKPLL